MSDKETVIVRKEDFFVHKYGVIITCPYCKWELYFQSFEKRIDKTDTCPNCGKKVRVVSEE